MDKATLEKRVNEIEQAIQQAIGQVNLLQGRKQELLYMIQEGLKVAEVVEKVVSLAP